MEELRKELLAFAKELEAQGGYRCDDCLVFKKQECDMFDSCLDSMSFYCARRIREIVEHEAENVTTVSAYDLLPEDEREAIDWVREHGGIDHCESYVRCAQDSHDSYMYLVTGIGEALGIHAYKVLEMEDDEIIEEVKKRAMPEGMEWPRYEDGEPVRLGEHWEEDGFDESVTRIDSIEFADDGVRFENEYNEVFCRYGARVKRPAPKVLDADGKEIRVGDTVWDVESGIEYEVVGIHTDEDSPVRVMRTDGSHLAKATKSDMLTNQRPVLDADGVPIKKGDTVWHKATDAKYRVFRFSAVENCVWGESDLGCFLLDCSMLTHEQPDSWERLEEDARMEAFDYVAQRKPEVGEFTSISTDKCIDLVRRAKKLAGDA